MTLEKATQPTMYFIGVTTEHSSIMKVFPEWVKALGLKDAVIKGIDIAIHADPAVYRKVVEFIKNDPLSMGALVTTHKIDLYNAAKDLFEYLDPYATQFGELSSISKRDNMLCGHAKDPITCGMAMEAFLPSNYWRENPEAGVFIMGAGGSAISICSYYMRNAGKGNDPAEIAVANRSQPRLTQIEKVNAGMNPAGIPTAYYLTPNPGENDAALEKMGKGSLVINATGLGKDRPGSPLTDDARFPEGALVWELNYRGERLFMQQAQAQQSSKGLTIVDGWMYFIYGWTQVIAEVFHIDILGERLEKMDRLAAKFNIR
ncbi:MAG: shikimate dehydrogenase [Oscillospiraceae bacterium]|nr:shikimate dehydrogenase [Oscillospiraceae bacterium]